MKFFRVFIGEFASQRRNFFGRFSALITLVLWPILSCAISYFTYQSFQADKLSVYGISSKAELFVFLLCGGLVYNCYWSVVQSAGQIRYDRINGTLEKIFLSPADRNAFVYGRSFGAVVFNTWMLTVFSFAIFLIYGRFSLSSIAYLLLGYIILILSSTIWGGFITTLFLFSRDSNAVFIICDKPMSLLSGTSFPIAALPHILMFAASIFPSAYLIELFRHILLQSYQPSFHAAGFILIHLILILATSFLVKKIERYNYQTGGWERY